jgi:hypothetical protein
MLKCSKEQRNKKYLRTDGKKKRSEQPFGIGAASHL